jgi:hypothetical protein
MLNTLLFISISVCLDILDCACGSIASDSRWFLAYNCVVRLKSLAWFPSRGTLIEIQVPAFGTVMLTPSANVHLPSVCCMPRSCSSDVHVESSSFKKGTYDICIRSPCQGDISRRAYDLRDWLATNSSGSCCARYNDRVSCLDGGYIQHPKARGDPVKPSTDMASVG